MTELERAFRKSSYPTSWLMNSQLVQGACDHVQIAFEYSQG